MGWVFHGQTDGQSVPSPPPFGYVDERRRLLSRDKANVSQEGEGEWRRQVPRERFFLSDRMKGGREREGESKVFASLSLSFSQQCCLQPSQAKPAKPAYSGAPSRCVLIRFAPINSSTPSPLSPCLPHFSCTISRFVLMMAKAFSRYGEFSPMAGTTICFLLRAPFPRCLFGIISVGCEKKMMAGPRVSGHCRDGERSRNHQTIRMTFPYYIQTQIKFKLY